MDAVISILAISYSFWPISALLHVLHLEECKSVATSMLIDMGGGGGGGGGGGEEGLLALCTP